MWYKSLIIFSAKIFPNSVLVDITILGSQSFRDVIKSIMLN